MVATALYISYYTLLYIVLICWVYFIEISYLIYFFLDCFHITFSFFTIAWCGSFTQLILILFGFKWFSCRLSQFSLSYFRISNNYMLSWLFHIYLYIYTLYYTTTLCTKLHSTKLHCTELHYTLQHYIVIRCTVIHYTSLQRTLTIPPTPSITTNPGLRLVSRVCPLPPTNETPSDPQYSVRNGRLQLEGQGRS